ncbi:MAG: hypothetical protein LRY71_18395 [Bacillaceae bacterium]|nr:hypothetical protein [Bacillaceae bacterium]
MITDKEKISEAKVDYANVNSMVKEYKGFSAKINQIIESQSKSETLTERLKVTEEKRNAINEQLTDASDLVEQQLRQWEKGQAALLAKQLEHGTPCPVCGSEHHPNPSELHVDFPSEKEIKQAQLTLKEIEAEKRKIDQHYYEAKTQLEAQLDYLQNLRAELQQGLPTKFQQLSMTDLKIEIHESSSNLQRKLSTLNDHINQEERLQSEITQLGGKKEQLTQKIQTCSNHYDEQYTIYVETKRDVTKLSESLPEDLRNESAYEKKYAAIGYQLKQLELALAEAENKVDQLKQKVATSEGAIQSLQAHLAELQRSEQEADQSFKEILVEMGFESVESYQRAVLDQVEIDTLEEQVQLFREEYRSVSDRLTDLVDQLKDVNKPNMIELNGYLEEVTATVHSLQEDKNLRYHKIESNRMIYNAIKELNTGLEEVEKQYTVLGELADISSGKNAYKLTFERYVLASFLDQILVAANARLNRMTNGRFKLLRKKRPFKRECTEWFRNACS